MLEVQIISCFDSFPKGKKKMKEQKIIKATNYLVFTWLPGLSDVPVMCTTIERTETDLCDWYSCGEWCLSKVRFSDELKNNGFHWKVKWIIIDKLLTYRRSRILKLPSSVHHSKQNSICIFVFWTVHQEKIIYLGIKESEVDKGGRAV